MEYLSLILLTLFVLFITGWIATEYLKDRLLTFVIFLSVIFRIAIIQLNQIHRFLPAKPDALFYFHLGVQITDVHSYQQFMNLITLNKGVDSIGMSFYALINAFFIEIFGPYLHVMPLINTAAYVLFVIFLIYRVENIIYRTNDSKKWIIAFAITLLFLFPGGLSLSVDNLRDLWVCGGIIFFIEFLDKENKTIYTNIIAISAFLFVTILRPVMAFILIAILIWYFFVYHKKIKIYQLLLIALMILLFFVFLGGGLLNLLNSNVLLEFIKAKAFNSTKSYPINADYNSLWDLIYHSPQRLFYYLFYPFPWKISSYRYLIPTMESIYNLFLFGFGGVVLYKYLRKKQHLTLMKLNRYKNKLLFLLGSSFIGLFTLSLIESQFSSAIRHRIAFSMLFCVTVYLEYFFLRNEIKNENKYVIVHKSNL